MFWIIHLFALLLFWPALFVTVPLHLIAGRMAPRPAPAQVPPPLPGERPAGHVPGWFTALVMALTALFVYGMYQLLAPAPMDSMPVSAPPRAAPAKQPSVEQFKVASDSAATYQLISVEGPPVARKIVTLREGPSGKMYSTRVYNCEALKVKQLGASETIERMQAYKGPTSWAPIVPGSIADGIGGVACKRR